MDFKKLGQQARQLRKQAEDKLGDRSDPEVLKKEAKDLREILAGDGSLADKAKEAQQRLKDPDRGADKKATTNDPESGPEGPASDQ